MMQWYLSALVCLLVPVVSGYAANKTYPSFAHCDQKLVSAIKGYWNTTGIPQNALQTMQQSGLYTLSYTSYDHHNSDNRCIYMNTTDGVMDFTFIPENGNEPVKTNWKVEEGEDNIIKGKPLHNDAPEHRWNWYQIYLNNGVSVCYVCSDLEGSQEPPLIDILVAHNSSNHLTASVVSEMYSLVQQWGFKPKYIYGQHCLLSDLKATM